MKGLLVDSNVILDIFLDDPNWADWSESANQESSFARFLYWGTSSCTWSGPNYTRCNQVPNVFSNNQTDLS